MTTFSAPLLPPDPTGCDGSRWSVYRMVDDIDVQFHVTPTAVWWVCVQCQSDGTLLRTEPTLERPDDDDSIRRWFS